MSALDRFYCTIYLILSSSEYLVLLSQNFVVDFQLNSDSPLHDDFIKKVVVPRKPTLYCQVIVAKIFNKCKIGYRDYIYVDFNRLLITIKVFCLTKSFKYNCLH